MHRMRCSLLAAAALLALGGSLLFTREAHAQQPGVSTDSLTLPVGDQGTVTLQADDIPAPGLGAWLIDITYSPAAVSVVSCTPLQQLGVCNDTFLPDTVRLAGVNTDGLQGTFSLASMVFRCNGNATSGLTLTVQRFVDTEFNEIAVSVQHGTITCGAPIRFGDVNCDQAVSSIDAALILQYSASIVGSLACQPAGDVNHDAAITPVDAALILQYVAGLISSLPS